LASLGILYILVIGSSLWAGFDASSLIKQGATKKDLGGGPIAVFIVCLLIWIIAFPYYLVHRSRFKSTQQLNLAGPTQARPTHSPSTPIIASSSESVADEIKKLAKLRKRGLLSKQEYEAQKNRLLS
jgi:hypothetical protein